MISGDSVGGLKGKSRSECDVRWVFEREVKWLVVVVV